MKKLLVVVLFLILVQAVAMAGPLLTVPETHWDFGLVPMNCVISHDYWIVNKGNDTLRIFEVKPG